MKYQLIRKMLFKADIYLTELSLLKCGNYLKQASPRSLEMIIA